MQLPPVSAIQRRIVCLALLCGSLAAGCGGGGGSVASAPGGSGGLSIELMGPAPGPLGLLERGSLSWRSNRAGTYQVSLRPAGDPHREKLLASGSTAALVPVDLALHGADLDPFEPSVLTISITDGAGFLADLALVLEARGVEVFDLGVGGYDDVVFDATRDELLVSSAVTGLVQFFDADPLSLSYGSRVALLPPGPDVGPRRIAVAPDGGRGYLLYRSTMIEYDLTTLEIENNLLLPGAYEPSGIVATPDSSRAYLGYFHTLLWYLADPAQNPPLIEGTEITDGLVQGGDVTTTPDGSLALMAWFGTFNRGLWIVDIDPLSLEFNELVSEQVFTGTPVPEVFGFVEPKVSVPPSGVAAYTGALARVIKVDLTDPTFPVVAERDFTGFTGLLALSDLVELQDFVLVWEPFGQVALLDEDLNLVGETFLAPGLADRAAVDELGERLFFIRNKQGTASEVLVVPL